MRLIFGTAGIYTGGTNRKTRISLLETAASNGISGFDTAPIYGLGLAEEELGTFLGSVEKHFEITSKVGRLVAPALRSLRRYQMPVRRAVEIARKSTRATPRAGAISAIRDTQAASERTLSELRGSIDRSMYLLGRLDCLLIHDVDYSNWTADLWQEMQSHFLPSQTRIGVSGEQSIIRQYRDQIMEAHTVQTRCSSPAGIKSDDLRLYGLINATYSLSQDAYQNSSLVSRIESISDFAVHTFSDLLALMVYGLAEKEGAAAIVFTSSKPRNVANFCQSFHRVQNLASPARIAAYSVISAGDAT